MKNSMKLCFDALSKNEAFARSTVAAFAVELNPTLDEINDIKTAISEAVTNSIVHGYSTKDDAKIEIEASVVEKTLHIRVVDFGVGIADIDKARQPFFTTKPEQERSGMGFTVMETFMDSLEVFPNAPCGLVVKMSKKIG